LARFRWVHTVRARYRAARRDHPAGGRLERHPELRVGGAPGSAPRLICDRTRALIRVAEKLGLRTPCRIIAPPLVSGRRYLASWPQGRSGIRLLHQKRNTSSVFALSRCVRDHGPSVRDTSQRDPICRTALSRRTRNSREGDFKEAPGFRSEVLRVLPLRV